MIKGLIESSTFRILILSSFSLLANFSKADTKVIWEKMIYPESYHDNSIEWDSVDIKDEWKIKDFNSFKKKRIQPSSLEDFENLMKVIEPIESDFLKPIRLSPSFPTNYQLDELEAAHSIFSISSFSSGGAAGGSGNQNYSYIFDYGINEHLQVSVFYSVADDPLYSLINGNKVIPNYWEIYGAAFKRKLFNFGKWTISASSSFESWNINNGDDVNGNIFNSEKERLSTSTSIGSFGLPLTRKVNNKLDVNFIVGGTFLPESIGRSDQQSNFYGNNFYVGSGFTWKARQNIYSSASISYPFGPGNNAFNSEKEFYRTPIYTLGINYDINPIIGLEGKITNGFGVTPSSSLLTIPSANKPLYFAGINYKPGRIDSPQRNFSTRENSLVYNGLTVSSALIPPRGRFYLSTNIDSKGSYFSSIANSLSNSFQLDIVNLGSFKDINGNSLQSGKFFDNYLNENNFNTRVGGKFILLSPLRSGGSWLSSRVSVGRNQQNMQGYLFSELVNTFNLNKYISVNVNPKIVYSGVGVLRGLGLSTNIQISQNLQLLPEVNLALSKDSETNSTIAIRRSFGRNFMLDIYASTAAGLQDIGQLLGSKEVRQGIRFHLLY